MALARTARYCTSPAWVATGPLSRADSYTASIETSRSPPSVSYIAEFGARGVRSSSMFIPFRGPTGDSLLAFHAGLDKRSSTQPRKAASERGRWGTRGAWSGRTLAGTLLKSIALHNKRPTPHRGHVSGQPLPSRQQQRMKAPPWTPTRDRPPYCQLTRQRLRRRDWPANLRQRPAPTHVPPDGKEMVRGSGNEARLRDKTPSGPGTQRGKGED